MSAPVVTPGGAPQPPAGVPRGAGRRDEPSPGEGTFAALLAALAPAAAQPGGAPAAGPAPAEGQVAVAGAALTDSLQIFLGQPLMAGIHVEGQGTSDPGPVALTGQALLAGPDAQGTAPAVQAGLPGLDAGAAMDLQVQVEPVPVPGSETGPQTGQNADPVTQDLLGKAAGAQGPQPSGAQGGVLHSPAPATVDPAAAARDDSAPLNDLPVDAAPPPARPEGGSTGGIGAGGGTAGQPGNPGAPTGPDTVVHSAERPTPEEGAPGRDNGGRVETAARQGPDLTPAAAPEPASGSEPAAGPAAARGLERLTAGRLQAEQVLAELARTIPELPDGEYRLTLRLHPEHLGEVRLELRLSGRTVYAAMEVSSAQARQALESRGEQLRQSLSDAGYSLAGFEVATGEGRQTRQWGGDERAEWTRPPVERVARREAPSAPVVLPRRSAGPRGGRLDTLA